MTRLWRWLARVLEGALHPPEPTGWIVWYRTPLNGQTFYIMLDHHGFSHFTVKKEKATAFATELEAEGWVPVSDGSVGIEGRTGTEAVWR